MTNIEHESYSVRKTEKKPADKAFKELGKKKASVSATDVFAAACTFISDSIYWLDEHEIFTINDIANFLNISHYTATKMIHKLRNEGFLRNANDGRPAEMAWVSSGIEVCPSLPPLRGFTLTEQAKETEIFKNILESMIQHHEAEYKKVKESLY